MPVPSPFAMKKEKEKQSASAGQGPGSVTAAEQSMASPRKPPVRKAGNYGSDATPVFTGTGANRNAASDKPNDPLLTGKGAASPAQSDAAAATVGAPSMNDRVGDLMRQDQYQKEREAAGRSRLMGDRLMAQNAVKRALGVGFERMDDVVRPKTPEQQENRRLAADITAGQDAQYAEQEYARSLAQQNVQRQSQQRPRLPRPPGSAFDGQTAGYSQPQQQQPQVSIQDLLPSQEEMAQYAIDNPGADPNQLIQSRLQLYGQLTGQDMGGGTPTPAFAPDQVTQIEDGQQVPDAAGQWWMRVGGELYPIAPPANPR